MSLLNSGWQSFKKNGFRDTFRRAANYFASRTWEGRIHALENQLRDMRWHQGINTMSGRLDWRITRLEILSYYSNPAKYAMLDEEQREILRFLSEDYLLASPKFFPRFPAIQKACEEGEKVSIKKDSWNSLWFWEIFGKKIYMSHDYDYSVMMAQALHDEFFTDNPHRYLEPEKDGVNIQEGAVLADVGAAEGLFGMMFIEKVKRLYLFESDDYWIDKLKRTFAPYKNKVEIVKGYVGDGPHDIKLDDFFKDKEPPSFVKMDIEGHEPFCVNGMQSLIASEFPLTMLICTYHRQGDWDYFYELLHERFNITSSSGYFWSMPDPVPPFFRHGVMRAVKKTKN